MRIVLDTNSLIQSIPEHSPYFSVWLSVLDAITKSEHVVLITPYYHFGLITADPDDNKFVDCAIAANARYIVTNDKHYDILQQTKFPVVDVIALKDFLKLLHR